MTEPDVPTVITQLRTLAAACRNLNDPYGSKVGDDIAAVAGGLQGWTLVKLPEPCLAPLFEVGTYCPAEAVNQKTGVPWLCTQPAGHVGPHVATGKPSEVFATWDNTEEVTA